jgi:NAD(P)-dependent dehydrogenase (short-subunit alcohol dehydrogenase family)
MSAARRAIVVGNSDGIGLALTRRLLAQGWTVTGLSRSPSTLGDPAYTHHVADVTAAGYPAALRAAGDAELCVYAAGVGDLLDLGDLAAQTRALEVNLVGAARTLEVVVPAMVAAGAGHIVGLSSIADGMASAEAPGYHASKAGLSAYLLGMRAALRPHGVHVSAVRFGFVDTKMAKSPYRPMMVPAERAVDVVLDCMRTRQAVVSFPRRMSVLARLSAPVVTGLLRR